MPSVGGQAKRLYTAEGLQQSLPAWSPDGKEIAFADETNLMVISSDGGRPQTIATMVGWEGSEMGGGLPKWSPDGTYIAGLGLTEEDKNQVLFVVNRRTLEIKRLTSSDDSAYKEIIDWHPDGDRISYMDYGSGDGSRIVSLSGGEPESFATMPDPMWDYIGIWGPDKRYYFMSTGFSKEWGLFATDEKTKEYSTIRYPTDRSIASLPTWSSNGSIMAWSEKESIRQLWMLTDYE